MNLSTTPPWMFSKILTAEFQFLSFRSPIFTSRCKPGLFRKRNIFVFHDDILTQSHREKCENKAKSVQLKAESDYAVKFSLLPSWPPKTVGRPDCIKLWWSLISRRYRRKWLVGMKLKLFQRSNEISYFSFLIFCSIRNYNLYLFKKEIS